MTATAKSVLGELRARGIRVRVRGGDLALHPRSSLDQELLAAVREHKAEIVALLQHGGGDLFGCADGGPGRLGPLIDDIPNDVPALPPLLLDMALLSGAADPNNPPSGWLYIRAGALAGCWVGPNGELDSGKGTVRDTVRGDVEHG